MSSHWTKKKPDRQGWWWFTIHPGYTESEPIRIEYTSCGDEPELEQKLMALNSTGGYNDYRGWTGFWSSEPISEPEPLGKTLGLEDKE